MDIGIAIAICGVLLAAISTVVAVLQLRVAQKAQKPPPSSRNSGQQLPQADIGHQTQPRRLLSKLLAEVVLGETNEEVWSRFLRQMGIELGRLLLAPLAGAIFGIALTSCFLATTGLSWLTGATVVWGSLREWLVLPVAGAIIAIPLYFVLRIIRLARGTNQILTASPAEPVATSKFTDVTTSMESSAEELVDASRLYFIISKQGISNNINMCLDVKGSEKTNGTPVIVYSFNGGLNQRWRFTHIDSDENGDYYRIEPDHVEGKCLDVQGAAEDEGSFITIYDWHESKQHQQWKLDKDGGYYVVRARHSRLCLNFEDGKLMDMPEIQTHMFRGGDNQKWELRPVPVED